MASPSDEQPRVPKLVVDDNGNVVRLEGVKLNAKLVPPAVESKPGQPAAPDAADEQVVWDPASRISMDGVTPLRKSANWGGGDGGGADGGGCGGDGGC